MLLRCFKVPNKEVIARSIARVYLGEALPEDIRAELAKKTEIELELAKVNEAEHAHNLKKDEHNNSVANLSNVIPQNVDMTPHKSAHDVSADKLLLTEQ
jgi:hypothetical protein